MAVASLNVSQSVPSVGSKPFLPSVFSSISVAPLKSACAAICSALSANGRHSVFHLPSL